MKNYSNSRCSRCQGNQFEMVEDTPTGSAFKLMYVRCSSCKTVIGLTDYYNIGDLIYKLAEKLNIRLER